MRTTKLKAALWVIVPLVIMATIVITVACAIFALAKLTIGVMDGVIGPDRTRTVLSVLGMMIPLCFLWIRAYRPELYERLNRR